MRMKSKGKMRINPNTKKPWVRGEKKGNLMLHAYKINFSIEGIKYKYSAELPLAFKKILKEKYLKNYL